MKYPVISPFMIPIVAGNRLTIATRLRKALRPIGRFLLPVMGGLLAYLLIPIALSRYNDIRMIREARQSRAVKFGDSNDDLNRKIIAMATLLRTFGAHNSRMKVSGRDLIEARKELYKKFNERYLDADATVWWQPTEFVREANTVNLLSNDEMQDVERFVRGYNESVLVTMNQIVTLWHFLDSPDYQTDEHSQERIRAIESEMDRELAAQYTIRQDFVRKISLVFAESNYRTQWYDLIGF